MVQQDFNITLGAQAYQVPISYTIFNFTNL